MNTVIIYVLLASAAGWMYTSNIAKEKEIDRLIVSIRSQRIQLEDKIKKVAFNVRALERKKQIEKGIKQDDSKAVGINVMRIYY